MLPRLVAKHEPERMSAPLPGQATAAEGTIRAQKDCRAAGHEPAEHLLPHRFSGQRRSGAGGAV